MAKEFFHYPETAKLFDLLEETSNRSAVSRGQAFEDFLLMSVCALSGQRMEEQYLHVVAKHTAGPAGKRGCDSIARMFAELVAAMEQDTRDQMRDIIGDLFQGCITYGERGQFLTPMPICEMMAQMTINGAPSGEESAETGNDAPAEESAAAANIFERRSVYDPCSGSGRMLLAAAQISRHWEFIGQDVDLRCTQMTALNLAFRGLYGYAIHGNTLALETKLVYRTGFDGVGFLREISLAACPVSVHDVIEETQSPADVTVPENDESAKSKKQLRLF